ncbi:hypothetical protein PHEL85_2407 [Polaribacter sp. Hel1_85]|nr:hypothetical protein PHEL85_2407 [Polaribacter sp. Hel1_85]
MIFTAVISCEKDFTDIGSGIISNTKFDTSSLLVDIEIENSPIVSVKSDNISAEPGQYLLGVHASDDYEKIEASIVSQLAISTALQVVDDANVYDSDTTVVTKVDTVFLRLPYQVTLNDDGDAYELDSIIGNQSKAFNLNIYQTSTYLSRLDPTDPSKVNSYSSNDVDVFEKTGSELNVTTDFKFLPALTDSILVKRWLSNGALATIDTVTYTSSTTSTIPLPFAVIPLKEDKIKELFLDKYESAEFDSQDAFNNYFRGVILEATGNEGSLISLNFSGTVKPSIEVYYTNSVVAGGVVIDTIHKNDSFLLSGIRTSTYKMEDKVYPVNNQVILQGAAGSEATIKLFGADSDGDGLADKIDELRDDLLINDASLTFYVNEEVDITAIPYQLFLYKSDETSFSHIKDAISEGFTSFGGLLEEDEDGNKRYTFKITDYISDILSGETGYSLNTKLRLKVINKSTDLKSFVSISDTIHKNYSWNPKAVTLFNHSDINGNKKAELKISYSEKKN